MVTMAEIFTGTAVELKRPTPENVIDAERIIESVGSSFNEEEREHGLERFKKAVYDEENHYAFIACANGEVLGFVIYGPMKPEEDAYRPGYWDLYWVVVDQTLHSRGVGRQLMTAAEEDIFLSHNGTLVWVETSGPPREDYEATRKFYYKLGYGMIKEVKDYWSQGDHLNVFAKDFNMFISARK